MTEEQIMNQYKALVLSQLRRFSSMNRIDREDLKQCGFIGLINAHRKWDNTRNIKFITYATKCIYNAMLRECLKLNKKKLYTNKKIIDKQIGKEIKYPEILYDLSPIHQDIAIMLYSKNTIADISKKYNKDKQWVKKQINKIRKFVKDE